MAAAIITIRGIKTHAGRNVDPGLDLGIGSFVRNGGGSGGRGSTTAGLGLIKVTSSSSAIAGGAAVGSELAASMPKKSFSSRRSFVLIDGRAGGGIVGSNL
jgi:hypothetical protein